VLLVLPLVVAAAAVVAGALVVGAVVAVAVAAVCVLVAAVVLAPEPFSTKLVSAWYSALKRPLPCTVELPLLFAELALEPLTSDRLLRNSDWAEAKLEASTELIDIIRSPLAHVADHVSAD
jgi:hypothetical protein